MSDSAASARRRELDIPGKLAVQHARETMLALGQGRYRSAAGSQVDFAALQQRALSLRESIPAELPLAPPDTGACPGPLRVRIENATTLGAARALIGQGLRPLALNFANGLRPGGGFLNGARAQEESLCRQTGLYPTLEGDPMYERHLRAGSRASSSAAILSPEVPVIRGDDGALLDAPWRVDIVTCAAPVAGAVGLEATRVLLRERIHRVLAIAAARGFQSLVLGAWGCGAFRNDPVTTATDFRDALTGPYFGAFSFVSFAITDWSPERKYLGPFRDAFR